MGNGSDTNSPIESHFSHMTNIQGDIELPNELSRGLQKTDRDGGTCLQFPYLEVEAGIYQVLDQPGLQNKTLVSETKSTNHYHPQNPNNRSWWKFSVPIFVGSPFSACKDHASQAPNN